MSPAVTLPVVWPMTIAMWPDRSRKVRSAVVAAAESAAVLGRVDGLFAAAGGQRLGRSCLASTPLPRPSPGPADA
jgi:hypothetical protein